MSLKFLFRQIDIAPLIFVRIVFGMLGLLDVLGVWIRYHLMLDSFNPGNLQIKYYGFLWVQTMPDPWLSIAFWITILAALGIILGKWYRLSATIFAIGFSYIFFLEKCHYLNHGYLFCVLSYLMIFVPANKAFSLDLKSKPHIYANSIPHWPLWLIKFLMATVYIYGGIAKINADWLCALPLKMWLPYKKNYFLIGPLLEQEWTAWLMSYGGILHDLFIIPLMLYRPTRKIAFFLCCLFHITNTMVFQIGIFPWLSIALTALFFPYIFLRQMVDLLQRKLSIVRKWNTRYLNSIQPIALNKDTQYVSKFPSIWSAVIVLFCGIQLLAPFRHHLYDGNVAWTEEGHRYSWRMMLRGKKGTGYYTIKNLKNDQEKKVRGARLLSKKQYRKYKSHPDMILYVAHHLRDKYMEEWDSDSVAVYPHFRVGLNGRNAQPFTDSSVDLAQEEWSWTKSWHWVLPLDFDDFPEKYKPKNQKSE